MHRFKPTQPPSQSASLNLSLVSDTALLKPSVQLSQSQPASLLDNDDDFGDFAGPAIQSQPPPLTVSTGLQPPPPPPDNNVGWTFPALQPQSKPAEKLPAVPAVVARPTTTLSGNDRYSAIRDLLGDDTPLSQPPPAQPPQPLPFLPSAAQPCAEEEEEDFGDFAEFTSPPPPPVISPSPGSFPSFPGSLRPQLANLESLFTSGPPVIPSTTSMFSSDTDTVKSPPDQSEELDMWSLPSGQCHVQDPLPTPSQILHSNQPPLPFLSSSPPPSPGVPAQSSDLTHLNVEEFSLPSDQFGFSEQEIFGIKKQKKVKEVLKPQSIQDVLSLSKESKQRESPIISIESKPGEKDRDSLSPDNISLEPTEPTSPTSAASFSSPAKISSTAASEGQNTTVTDLQVLSQETEREPSPYYEWLLILTEIRSLFDCVLNTFNDIFNEDLKEDLVTNPEGKAYLENLSLVLKVYKRIVRSSQSKLSLESERPEVARIKQLMADIDLSWASMEDHCRQYRPLGKVWEEDVGDGVCGICLCPGAGLVYSSSLYHPECANYWVNCVADSLPHLSQ